MRIQTEEPVGLEDSLLRENSGQGRVWISLITFCAVRALASAIGLAIIIKSVALFANAQPEESSPPAKTTDVAARTFAGLVTDSNCGAKHATDSGQNPADCAKACVRKGSKYTLVNGDQTYILEGSAADLEAVAGQRASIVGTLDGNIITVRSAKIAR